MPNVPVDCDIFTQDEWLPLNVSTCEVIDENHENYPNAGSPVNPFADLRDVTSFPTANMSYPRNILAANYGDSRIVQYRHNSADPKM